MKKLLIFILLLIPWPVLALTYPKLYSPNVLVYDLTDDQELYAVNKDVKRNIASLTKIMTTITAIEKIKNLDEKVTLKAEWFYGIPWDASIAGLQVGQTLSYRDLLYASILPSGADATQALAYSLCGSVPNFVAEMNKNAQKIGMKNTNFVNVTGYDVENHYSTLSDVLLLLKYALKNETFRTVYTTQEYTLATGLQVKSTLDMYNKKLGLDVSRILGSKTGFTDWAGVCISALFKSHDHELLIITTGAEHRNDDAYNLRDALSLIAFIDDNYGYQTLVAENQEVKKIPLRLSTSNEYTITSPKTITKYLPKDYDPTLFKVDYEGLDTLDWHNRKGDKIGTLKYYYADELLQEEPVYLQSNIALSWPKFIHEYFWLIGSIIIVIILAAIIIFRPKKRHKRHA